MRDRAHALSQMRVGFWGPQRTRGGLLDGTQDTRPESKARRRAPGRIALNLERAARAGTGALVISDENMLGRPCVNLAATALYPEAGQRLARLHGAFGGRITRVVLTIRAQDLYWASLLAHLVERGFAVPQRIALERISFDPRGWADVISDLACALGGVPLRVVAYEEFGGRPDALLSVMTGAARVPPPHPGGYWANRSLTAAALAAHLARRGEAATLAAAPTGRWMPFSDDAAWRLKERYADDLTWLAAGAEGLAQYTTSSRGQEPGQTGGEDSLTRGIQRHEGRHGPQIKLA